MDEAVRARGIMMGFTLALGTVLANSAVRGGPPPPSPAPPASPRSAAPNASAAARYPGASLERREDLARAQAAFEATRSKPQSIEFLNNAAAGSWLLEKLELSRVTIEKLVERYPAATGDEGIMLNAHLFTGKSTFDRPVPGRSPFVDGQKALNNQIRADGKPNFSSDPRADEFIVVDLKTIASDGRLPSRLRAKLLCLAAVFRARGAIRARDLTGLQVALDGFKQAKNLDPSGAIGKLAEENMARLQAWRSTKLRK